MLPHGLIKLFQPGSNKKSSKSNICQTKIWETGHVVLSSCWIPAFLWNQIRWARHAIYLSSVINRSSGKIFHSPNPQNQRKFLSVSQQSFQVRKWAFYIHHTTCKTSSNYNYCFKQCNASQGKAMLPRPPQCLEAILKQWQLRSLGYNRIL